MFSNLVALLKDKLHLTNFGKKRLQFTESQNGDKRRLSVVALNNSNIGKHIYECNVFFHTSIVYNVQVLCSSCSKKNSPIKSIGEITKCLLLSCQRLVFYSANQICILFSVTISNVDVLIHNNKLNIL